MDNLRQEFNKLKVLIEKQFKREYDLIALADKRLELLKEIHDRCQNKGWCPFCTMLEVDTFLGHEHDPDCELAEAIDETK